MTPFLQPVLAREIVRYVGEPVAVVVAASRAAAEDAAAGMAIEWEQLPVVADAAAALRPDGPRIHAAGNVASRWRFDLGDAAGALAKSAVARAGDLRDPAAYGNAPGDARAARELRPCAPPARGVWADQGASHQPRAAAAMLRMGEGDIRFIEPDVGGSFGSRGEFYPEDYLIPWLSLRLQKPMRWIEDGLSISPRSTIPAKPPSR